MLWGWFLQRESPEDTQAELSDDEMIEESRPGPGGGPGRGRGGAVEGKGRLEVPGMKA